MGFALHFSPQLQSMMADRLQATIAAYQVYGLKAAISAGVNGVMASW